MPHDSSFEGARGTPETQQSISRREAFRIGAGAVAGAVFAPGILTATNASSNHMLTPGPLRRELIRKAIPSSGEEIPVIGLGTWQTFMVDPVEDQLAPLREVLRSFVDMGGTVVDSSPMYGNAEEVVGDLAVEIDVLDDLWVATKVWTEGEEEGRNQMEQSISELRRERIELMQVHNLVDVETHLDTLEEWKEAGRFRYIGITTSSTRQYDAVEALLDDERLDFLQINYSLGDRQSAERILPAAQERGVAVMINRPFSGGELFSRFLDQPLPQWASEFDCTAWSQFFLKYVVSHPAVTCAIPATSNPDHLRENMGAAVGRLPDASTRRRMEEVIDA